MIFAEAGLVPETHTHPVNLKLPCTAEADAEIFQPASSGATFVVLEATIQSWCTCCFWKIGRSGWWCWWYCW